MSELAENLKHILDAMSEKDYLASWNSVKDFHDVGPTIEEYLEEVLMPLSVELNRKKQNYLFGNVGGVNNYTIECNCGKAA